MSAWNVVGKAYYKLMVALLGVPIAGWILITALSIIGGLLAFIVMLVTKNELAGHLLLAALIWLTGFAIPSAVGIVLWAMGVLVALGLPYLLLWSNESKPETPARKVS